MSTGKPQSAYRVFPLPVVQRDAKKMLTTQQLREGIALTKRLRGYPDVPDLSIERCGDGFELRIETPVINRQGWLRAIFWVHEKSRTIYIVDLFWKKTNQVSVADLHRANYRIRQLKAQLA
jgi:phage-related protein